MDRLLCRRAVPVACGLAALLCAGTWVMGQSVFTDYAGTLTPTGIDHPGTLECLNGQPTGVPWYLGVACSPSDSRVRIRGVVLKFNQETSDPRVNGKMFVTLNANLDQWPGSGPIFGTSRLEVTQGGVWNCVWTGERSLTSETIRAVCHGEGGNIEGLKNETQMARAVSSPLYPKYTVTGTLLQPGGK